MNSSAYSLWIGGYPATEIAAHTPPTWETNADGGIGEISFALALSRRSQHQALKSRALVQVKCGPLPVATGLLTEPDRTTWECKAFGLSVDLDKILALDALGSNTRDVGVAVTRAIGMGWLGSNPASVSGIASGDPTGNPITVAKLLEDYATQTGQRWGVDGRGVLYMRPDPTEPRWLFSPNSAAFGATDEDVAVSLAGIFDDGTRHATAFVSRGIPEQDIDITERGVMTHAEAVEILEGMLARNGGTKWTNAVTLTREELTTRGGSPAFFPQVVGGQMARALGLASGVLTHAPWLDVVIGRTVYTAGARTITVEPLNTAPRDFVSVIAAA